MTQAQKKDKFIKGFVHYTNHTYMKVAEKYFAGWERSMDFDTDAAIREAVACFLSRREEAKKIWQARRFAKANLCFAEITSAYNAPVNAVYTAEHGKVAFMRHATRIQNKCIQHLFCIQS